MSYEWLTGGHMNIGASPFADIKLNSEPSIGIRLKAETNTLPIFRETGLDTILNIQELGSSVAILKLLNGH